MLLADVLAIATSVNTVRYDEPCAAMHAVLVGETERRTAAEVEAGLEAIQRHLGAT